MPTLIRRDPFARTELHRERVYDLANVCHGCSECGSVLQTSSGRKYLFRYRTESDGGRQFAHKGLFCSISCHSAWH